MTDLSKFDHLSDAELEAIAGSTPVDDFSNLSDEKLMEIAGEKPQSPQDPSTAEDVVKSLGSGAVEGAVGAPYWMADMGNFVNSGVQKGYEYYRDVASLRDPENKTPLTRMQEKAIESYKPFFGSKEILAPAKELTGVSFYEPKTTAGSIANFAGNIGGFGVASSPKAATALSDKIQSIVGKGESLSRSLPGILGDVSSGVPKAASTLPSEVKNLDVLAEAAKGARFAKKPDTLRSGLEANKAISEAYHQASTEGSKLYKAAEAIGEGKKTSIGEIKQPLDELVQELSAQAATPQQVTVLRKLKVLQKNIDNPTGSTILDASGKPMSAPARGDIGLNELADLKKSLNEGFKRGDFTGSKDIPLVKVNQIIRDKISSLDKTHPEFVKALKNADEFWSTNVARPFKDNSEITKLWDPEDYYAWAEKLKNPNARGVTEGTVSRAATFLDSLNTAKAGRASTVADVLPKEKAVQILRDAIVNAKKSQPSVLNAAGELFTGHPIAATKTLISSAMGSKKSPLADLAKEVSPSGNIGKIGALGGLTAAAGVGAAGSNANASETGEPDIGPPVPTTKKNPTGLEEPDFGPESLTIDDVLRNVEEEAEKKKTLKVPAKTQKPQSSLIPESFEKEEGKKDLVYKDTNGNRTIGVGFNMDSGIARNIWKEAGIQKDFNAVRNGKQKITDAEAQKLFSKSYEIANSDIKSLVPNFDSLGKNQQEALTHLSYQYGKPRLKEALPGVIAMAKSGNMQGAAARLLASEYGKKYKKRAAKLARMLIEDSDYA